MNRSKKYALKELITKKYGEEKFYIGCFIVAQYLQFLKLNYWTADDIKDMCDSTEYTFVLQLPEAEALTKLFGLQTVEQLYNNRKKATTA